MACLRLWIHSRMKSLLLLLVFIVAGFLLLSRRIYLLTGETDIFGMLYLIQRSSVGQLETFNVTSEHPLCGCTRSWVQVGSNESLGKIKSSCGPAADVRGFGQKVVSYSFYGDTSSGYFRGIDSSAVAIDALYDGWVMRVYHDISPKDSKGTADLCRLVCNHSILDDCYVGSLKVGTATDFLSKFGMLWRFAVMGDPLVDLFAVRDLDSPIHQREVDAVHDWQSDGSTWHIMRDNPVHFASILGGMWGGNNRHNRAKMQRLRDEIFSRPNFNYKTYDQQLLSEIVWPEAVLNMTAHDSFLCGMFSKSKPWPTRRVGRTFVGDMFGLSITRECPSICRPPNHKDWTFC